MIKRWSCWQRHHCCISHQAPLVWWRFKVRLIIGVRDQPVPSVHDCSFFSSSTYFNGPYFLLSTRYPADAACPAGAPLTARKFFGCLLFPQRSVKNKVLTLSCHVLSPKFVSPWKLAPAGPDAFTVKDCVLYSIHISAGGISAKISSRLCFFPLGDQPLCCPLQKREGRGNFYFEKSPIWTG